MTWENWKWKQPWHPCCLHSFWIHSHQRSWEVKIEQSPKQRPSIDFSVEGLEVFRPHSARPWAKWRGWPQLWKRSCAEWILWGKIYRTLQPVCPMLFNSKDGKMSRCWETWKGVGAAFFGSGNQLLDVSGGILANVVTFSSKIANSIAIPRVVSSWERDN